MSALDRNLLSIVASQVLPEEVHVFSYLSASKDCHVLIICDQHRYHSEKEYSCRLTQAQLITAILTDVHKFNEYWNSPLMKALR